MPVRRAKARSRGLRPGLEKHKIAFHNQAGSSTFCGVRVLRLSKLAQQCFELFLSICSRLYFVPIKYDGAQVTVIEGRQRVMHYIVISIAAASGAHKAVVFGNVAQNYGFSVSTLMCLTMLFPYLLAPALGSGPYFMLQETVHLMNSWHPTLESLSSVVGKEVGPFTDPLVALKVIGVTLFPIVAAPALASLTVLFPMLPCAIHSALLDLGFGSSIPLIWLQLICFPFELLLLACCFGAAVGVIALVVGIGVLKIFHTELAKHRVTTVKGRILMMRAYTCGQIYNQILDVWYKRVVPPGMLCSGVAIVFSMFVTIRCTELPLIIYLLFPYATIVFTVVMFDLCHEGMVVIRASESILGTLRSKEELYYPRLPEGQRRWMLKQARALRHAYFSVGNFTEFNLDVPVSVWDEILNQLMFFLTL